MISRLIQRMKKSFAMQRVLWRGKEKKSKASVVMRSNNFPVVILSFFVVRSPTVSFCEVSRWLDMPEQPAIKLLWLCLSSIKGENNLRLFERSELERSKSFSVSSSNT